MDSKVASRIGIKPGYLPSLGVIASGLLITLSAPHIGISALIWIALVPWYCEIRKCTSFKKAILQSFWMSLIYSLGIYYWLPSALHGLTLWNLLLCICIFLLYGLFSQTQFILVGAFRYYFRNKYPTLSLFLISAIVYTLVDTITPKVFGDTLGYVLHGHENLRQIVDVASVYGLTLLICVVNEFCFLLLLNVRGPSNSHSRNQNHSVIVLASILTIASLIFSWIYGKRQNEIHEEKLSNAQRFLDVVGIQSNIGQISDKSIRKEQVAAEILRTYLRLSYSAISDGTKPDVIIWPETAYPFPVQISSIDKEGSLSDLKNFVKNQNIPLIFGTTFSDDDKRLYNGLVFLKPDSMQNPFEIYRKNKLFPIGEYIPLFGSSSAWIKERLFRNVDMISFGPLDQKRLFKLEKSSPKNEISVFPLICYESLFPSYSHASKESGANLILNISNDSRLASEAGARLHFAVTTLRSIENRLPVLRIANTGISGLISPTGKVTNHTGLNREVIFRVRIPIISM